jgi:uncharacterized protein (DUF1697 family)
MPRYVAFLRGMNLGGRRIGNVELCGAVAALGFSDVSAFLASGNVIFDGPGSATAITERLESGLAEQLGYSVPTFLRTAAQVRAIARVEPWERRRLEGRGKPQVIFLRRKPGKAAAASVADLATEDDWLALRGCELHWSPRGGLSEAELDLDAVEKLLGPTTIRTRNTIERLVAKHVA